MQIRALFLIFTLLLTPFSLARSEQQTQLIKALRKNDFLAAEVLIKTGLDLNYEMGLSPLVMMVRQKRVDFIELMLQHGADVNYIMEQPNTALIAAVMTGDLDLVNLILKAKPDLNGHSTTNPKRTAMMQAAESGYLDILKRLVESGASLTEGDYVNDQALAFAAYNEQPEIITYLISIGADINHANHRQLTPLDHAERSSANAAIQILLQHGALRGSEL
jgi:ankyrin repeat protein